MEPIKILVVEDEMIIAADISMSLESEGYEVTGIIPRGEAAIDSIRHDRPDLVLMDISLKGEWNGIQTAKAIGEEFQIPIIFLTANSDRATFEEAKDVNPYAFITKPFNRDDLARAIELTISRINKEKGENQPIEASDQDSETFILEDRIFVRSKDRMVKLALKDIVYIEAESNYSNIHTADGKSHLVSVTLKAFTERSQLSSFIRVHRSYVINLEKLEELGDIYLKVGGKQVPISKSYKEALYQRVKMI